MIKLTLIVAIRDRNRYILQCREIHYYWAFDHRVYAGHSHRITLSISKERMPLNTCCWTFVDNTFGFVYKRAFWHGKLHVISFDLTYNRRLARPFRVRPCLANETHSLGTRDAPKTAAHWRNWCSRRSKSDEQLITDMATKMVIYIFFLNLFE